MLSPQACPSRDDLADHLHRVQERRRPQLQVVRHRARLRPIPGHDRRDARVLLAQAADRHAVEDEEAARANERAQVTPAAADRRDGHAQPAPDPREMLVRDVRAQLGIELEQGQGAVIVMRVRN